mgnify:CR=1 FL=1
MHFGSIPSLCFTFWQNSLFEHFVHIDIPSERFVPITYVVKVKSLEEAIALNNSVPQGLSSALFTTSMRSTFRFLGPLVRTATFDSFLFPRPPCTDGQHYRALTAASPMSTRPAVARRLVAHLAETRRQGGVVSQAAIHGSRYARLSFDLLYSRVDASFSCQFFSS